MSLPKVLSARPRKVRSDDQHKTVNYQRHVNKSTDLIVRFVRLAVWKLRVLWM